MLLIGAKQHVKSNDYSADNPFIYWHECHASLSCYLRFLTDAWIYTMDGVAGLDNVQALAVINCYTQNRIEQLQMLEDCKSFARGVKQYHDEQAAIKRAASKD